MKRYRFRLEAVLRLRRAEEEQARAALIAANISLRQAIAARDAEVTRYRELTAATPATSVEGLLAEQAAAARAAACVSAAQRVVTNEAAAAAIAQVTWGTARRRVAVLERLDERRRAEHLEEERRAEASAVDDIVTSRYVPEQSGDVDRSPAVARASQNRLDGAA